MSALIKYGQDGDGRRTRNMTIDDIEYAAEFLDNDLMSIFGYKEPDETQDDSWGGGSFGCFGKNENQPVASFLRHNRLLVEFFDAVLQAFQVDSKQSHVAPTAVFHHYGQNVPNSASGP